MGDDHPVAVAYQGFSKVASIKHGDRKEHSDRKEHGDRKGRHYYTRKRA